MARMREVMREARTCLVGSGVSTGAFEGLGRGGERCTVTAPVVWIVRVL